MKNSNNNKYAIVFAGQGAQKPGMGKNLYESSPAARAVFDKAGDEIKFNCFEADEETLMQTEVTQPAVYTMDIAAYFALREALGIGKGGFPEPSGAAGFSLGEYAAFTATGAIGTLETGLELVKKRSLLMKEAGTNPDGSRRGAMAAGMGGKDAVLALVEKARGADVLEAVNFNSPQQTVVAGDAEAIKRFAALARDKSFGVRAIPLPVSGAFHSPIMRPAANGLAKALQSYSFSAPSFTVYLNATGGTFDDYEPEEPDRMALMRMAGMLETANMGGMLGKKRLQRIIETTNKENADEKIKSIMVRQIQSPVQWQKIVEAMYGAGIKAIIEVGPGKTLTGLTKKNAPEIAAMNVEDAESLGETVRRIREIV